MSEDLLKNLSERRRRQVQRTDPAPEMIQPLPTLEATAQSTEPERPEEEKAKGTYYLYPSLIKKAEALVDNTKGGWLWYLFTALVEVALAHPELHEAIRRKAIAAREADKAIANKKRKQSLLKSLSEQ